MEDIDNMIKVGFWRRTPDQESEFPYPQENSSNYMEGFVEKMALLKDEMMKNNNYYKLRCCTDFDDDNENDAKLEHLYLLQYKGWSRCRLCNCKNGTLTVCLNGYAFPSGYFHYINEHNIEVPVDFQRMICNLDL